LNGFLKGLEQGTIGCTIVVVTHLGGFGGFAPGFGGTYLVVTILWKGYLDSKFTSIFALRSIIINCLAPKQIGIALKPL
jgi:hypothetical protein